MKRIALLLAAAAFPAIALASVDVNTATKAELESEGIGSTAAQAIIDYRTKNGPFKSSDEVRKVISDAIAAKMNIGISISGPADAKAAAPQAKAAAPQEKAVAPQEKSADAKISPAPEAKSASAAAASKPAEAPKARDEPPHESVREQKRKDADDRKT